MSFLRMRRRVMRCISGHKSTRLIPLDRHHRMRLCRVPDVMGSACSQDVVPHSLVFFARSHVPCVATGQRGIYHSPFARTLRKEDSPPWRLPGRSRLHVLSLSTFNTSAHISMESWAASLPGATDVHIEGDLGPHSMQSQIYATLSWILVPGPRRCHNAWLGLCLHPASPRTT